MPNAKVTVKNLETSQQRTVTTNGTGNYVIPNLAVGHYSVNISATGFKKTTIPDVELQVAQTASVNAVLQLGQMTESVTVSGELPLMNTVSSSVSEVLDTKAVESMPLNGRDFWQLTQLTPGASYIQGGQNIPTNGTSIRASAVNVNVNGMSRIWTGWSLDGANITESQLGGTIIQPNVDALQEFRVQGADMSAEYGHTPSLINATLKSGGNQFHGDVYWFFRNNAMDARNFFFLPPPGVHQSKEPLHRDQSGGTLGGPIVRNRTFFFVDFEDTQLSQEQDFNNVVGSPAERLGDFSQLLSSKKMIADPLTGQPFAGNIIPTTRLSPQAKFFLPYMPQANFISGGAYHATVTNALTQALNKGDIKIDHQLTEKDHLMGRYSISNNQESDPNPYPAIGSFPLQSRGQDATIDLTHIFNPSWINDARVSYYRSYFNFGGALQGEDINEMAGFEGIPDPGFPQLAISGYSNFTGSPSGSRPKENRLRSWQFTGAAAIGAAHQLQELGAARRLRLAAHRQRPVGNPLGIRDLLCVPGR